jgi:hypothetical protein
MCLIYIFAISFPNFRSVVVAPGCAYFQEQSASLSGSVTFVEVVSAGEHWLFRLCILELAHKNSAVLVA